MTPPARRRRPLRSRARARSRARPPLARVLPAASSRCKRVQKSEKSSGVRSLAGFLVFPLLTPRRLLLAAADVAGLSVAV